MNLMEGLLNEIERCSKLVEQYESIGPAGAFGKAMIQKDIDRAKKAIAEGDTIEMMRVYDALKKCE